MNSPVGRRQDTGSHRFHLCVHLAGFIHEHALLTFTTPKIIAMNSITSIDWTDICLRIRYAPINESKSYYSYLLQIFSLATCWSATMNKSVPRLVNASKYQALFPDGASTIKTTNQDGVGCVG
jgi:hypothetical protein